MAVHELELRGAGGEPVDLWRTVVSHGVASLPPQEVDEAARTLTATLLVGDRARTVVVRAGRAGFAEVEIAGRAPSRADTAALLGLVSHMLRLDADLSSFYALIAEDADLAWAAAGAGRMLRSPTVLED